MSAPTCRRVVVLVLTSVFAPFPLSLLVNGSLKSLTALVTEFNQAKLDSNVGEQPSPLLPPPTAVPLLFRSDLSRPSPGTQIRR